MDKEIQVGNFVNIHCFDGSTITMQVTEIRDNIVYGVSQLGNHWANLKDVEKVITQEDKELLLKDLCARLPYGVICFAPDYEYGDVGKLWSIEPFEDLDPPIIVQYPKGNTLTKFWSEVKPYLRPMSSMTREELNTYARLVGSVSYSLSLEKIVNYKKVDMDDFTFLSNWLNKNMFDYRGLIERGLALVAPEDMYK